MINKKYQILYVDPPWKYGGTGGTKWLPASEYYQTMSFNELKKLQINKICEKDCLLFLWVVSSKLKECIEVGESWSFKYITVAFAWHKNRANVGNYTMSSVELCLLFKKGKIPNDRVRNPGQKQFHAEKVSKHSKKPAIFRERIEKMYPKSKKIELFSREKNKNWDSIGSDINFSIEEFLNLYK